MAPALMCWGVGRGSYKKIFLTEKLCGGHKKEKKKKKKSGVGTRLHPCMLVMTVMYICLNH